MFSPHYPPVESDQPKTRSALRIKIKQILCQTVHESVFFAGLENYGDPGEPPAKLSDTGLISDVSAKDLVSVAWICLEKPTSDSHITPNQHTAAAACRRVRLRYATRGEN
jgi:hypothetical protein